MTRLVGIVGGGILGMTAALRLAQSGVRVALVRALADDLGGLVGSFALGGLPRRPLLPRDPADRRPRHRPRRGARARATGSASAPRASGFYGDGRLFSMTTPKEFLPLPDPQPARPRAARRVRRALPAEARLRRPRRHPAAEVAHRLCGKKVVERMWAPLLDSKFDGRYDDLPATYIWSRSRRMATTRDSQRERGHGLARGRLLDADRRARREHPPARRRGRTPGRPCTASCGDDAVTGLLVPDGVPPVRPGPLHARAAAGAVASCARDRRSAPADHCRYLGVMCLVLRTRAQRQPVLPPQHHRPARPADDRGRDDARGRPGRRSAAPALRLQVRRPGTSRPGAPGRQGEPRSTWITRARSSPTSPTRTSSTRASSAPASTEPVHLIGGAKRLPDMFPAPGLAMASTAHVYPEIVSGQAVIGVADKVVPGILERLEAPEAGGGMSVARRSRCACEDEPAADRYRRRRAGARRPRRPRGRARCASPGAPGATSTATPATTSSRARSSPTASLPYIDFVYYYGPLAPLLAGLVSAVAGPGIGTIVALGLAITALIVAGTYALARTFVGPLGAFLAAALDRRRSRSCRTTTPTSCRTPSRRRSARCFLLGLLLALRQLGARETIQLGCCRRRGARPRSR